MRTFWASVGLIVIERTRAALWWVYFALTILGLTGFLTAWDAYVSPVHPVGVVFAIVGLMLVSLLAWAVQARRSS